MNVPDAIGLSRQLIVVTTKDWSASAARVRVFERKDGDWIPVRTMPAVVGENGMSWGLGLHPQNLDGRTKTEGDGTSPAGVFELGDAYGYATSPPKNTRWPYRPVSRGLCCVDDPKSRSYNRIVPDTAGRDWSTSEEMRREDDLYRWVIAVRHNAAPVRPAKGSCIFIHVWKNSRTGTSGCTALSRRNVEWLLRWLDPAARPLIVQLPAPQDRRYSRAWRLPALP